MGKEIVALIFGCLLVGFVMGILVQYLYGEPKCKHEYKEIINDCYNNKRTVVHMCMKCGKKKVTKVK